MPMKAVKLMQVAASAAIFSAAFALPAAAEVHYDHKANHRHHEANNDRPLTVRKHYHEPVLVAAPAPDPWHGPAAIVTGPVAVGGTIVGMPFRAVNSVFPAHGDPLVNPLVLIGAPVHFAGQVASLPFYAVGSAFGAPVVYDY